MAWERDSFVFYRAWAEMATKMKDPEEQRIFIMGIINYGLNGEEPDFQNVMLDLLWVGAKPLLDANQTRWENSKKGGAPKGNKNAKKQPKNNRKTTEKQPKNNQKTTTDTTEKQPNVNVNANVNVNENANEHEHVNANVNENVNVNEYTPNPASGEQKNDEPPEGEGWF